MQELQKLLGEFPVLEKIAAGLVIFALGIIQAFFWKSKADQDKRIDKNEESIGDAHNRITDQASMNNDKFARRDDMKEMEERLVRAMQNGFDGIKNDIRSINKD